MGYIVTSAKQGRLIRIQEEDINQFIVTEQIYMTSNGTHLLVNLQNVWNNQKEKYTFYQIGYGFFKESSVSPSQVYAKAFYTP